MYEATSLEQELAEHREYFKSLELQLKENKALEFRSKSAHQKVGGTELSSKEGDRHPWRRRLPSSRWWEF